MTMTTETGRQRAAEEQLAYSYVESPAGRLLLAGDERGVWLVMFECGRDAARPAEEWRESRAPLAEAMRQLEAYFRRELRVFDVPLHPVGTEFQLSVWNALPSIPYGSTTSYGELARRIGKPDAVRAVGAANGANPLSIILPCHRVIGGDGKLVGYGGGLPNKRMLLALERGDMFL
jgi:methylated-DNA-[protein]-cysteine S-methyltransferase